MRQPPRLAVILLSASILSCATTGAATSPPTSGDHAEDTVALCDQSVSSVYEQVRNSVIAISATSINPYTPRNRVGRAGGSGVIYDADQRLALTNAHVVIGAQHLAVVLNDGRTLGAEIVGLDPVYDLAVLRLQEDPGGDELSAARLADSEQVQVGQEVVAIGNPLGLRQTVSSGVVSAVDRVLPVAPFALSEPYIQTDAPINPGNSGGPLLDRCGEVIGINTAAILGAQNIGFAVPSNLVSQVAPRLVEDGRLVRPWVGFQGQLVDPQIAQLVRIPMVQGLLIEVVDRNGPAEREGLRGGFIEVAVDGVGLLVGGDIVTHVNGQRITTMSTLVTILRDLEVGDDMVLSVFRLGEQLTIRYRLPERPFLPSDMPGRTLLPGASDPGE